MYVLGVFTLFDSVSFFGKWVSLRYSTEFGDDRLIGVVLFLPCDFAKI